MKLLRYLSPARVHLDYAATTPMSKSVAAFAYGEGQRYPVNPGGIYSRANESHTRIEGFRKRMQELLHTEQHRIVFTRGGTESCNLAIAHAIETFRLHHPNTVPRVIISQIEHSAVYEYCKRLEDLHLVQLVILGVDERGLVSYQDIVGSLNDQTALVAIQYVNSEIGVIQQIKKITHAIRRSRVANKSQFPFVFTDAIQAGDICELRPQSMGVDYLSISASKFYGPRSGGVLCIPRHTIHELGVLVGGNQEFGVRPGTEDIFLIAGTVKAYEDSVANREQRLRHMRLLNNELRTAISELSQDILINNDSEFSSPHILHISIPNMDSDYAVLYYDAHGIEVASQSACSAHSGGVSRVIQSLWSARNIPKPEDYAHIRISFGRATKRADILKFIQVTHELLKQKYVRA